MRLPRRPECVVADFWGGEEAEDGRARWLDLVGDIGVEKLGAGKGVKVRTGVLVCIDDYDELARHLIILRGSSPTTSSRSPRRGTAYVACLCKGPKCRPMSRCASMVRECCLRKTGGCQRDFHRCKSTLTDDATLSNKERTGRR